MKDGITKQDVYLAHLSGMSTMDISSPCKAKFNQSQVIGKTVKEMVDCKLGKKFDGPCVVTSKPNNVMNTDLRSVDVLVMPGGGIEMPQWPMSSEWLTVFYLTVFDPVVLLDRFQLQEIKRQINPPYNTPQVENVRFDKFVHSTEVHPLSFFGSAAEQGAKMIKQFILDITKPLLKINTQIKPTFTSDHQIMAKCILSHMVPINAVSKLFYVAHPQSELIFNALMGQLVYAIAQFVVNPAVLPLTLKSILEMTVVADDPSLLRGSVIFSDCVETAVQCIPRHVLVMIAYDKKDCNVVTNRVDVADYGPMYLQQLLCVMLGFINYHDRGVMRINWLAIAEDFRTNERQWRSECAKRLLMWHAKGGGGAASELHYQTPYLAFLPPPDQYCILDMTSAEQHALVTYLVNANTVPDPAKVTSEDERDDSGGANGSGGGGTAGTSGGNVSGKKRSSKGPTPKAKRSASVSSMASSTTPTEFAVPLAMPQTSTEGAASAIDADYEAVDQLERDREGENMVFDDKASVTSVNSGLSVVSYASTALDTAGVTLDRSYTIETQPLPRTVTRVLRTMIPGFTTISSPYHGLNFDVTADVVKGIAWPVARVIMAMIMACKTKSIHQKMQELANSIQPVPENAETLIHKLAIYQTMTDGMRAVVVLIVNGNDAFLKLLMRVRENAIKSGPLQYEDVLKTDYAAYKECGRKLKTQLQSVTAADFKNLFGEVVTTTSLNPEAFARHIVTKRTSRTL